MNVDLKEQSNNFELKLPTIDNLREAGVHFGHKKGKWHPKMKPYLSGDVDATHIIDLEQTLPMLELAINFLKGEMANNKVVLFVGTGLPHRAIVKEVAEKLEMPYVSEHWVGGLLTNFKTINKRLEYFRDLEKKKEAGELEKYTKKEQLGFNKEIEKLRKNFSGIKKMMKLPDILLVINGKENLLAIKEAKKIKIPVIGLCDTNIDPSLFDYCIPANDDAISSVGLILETIAENIKNK